MARLGNSHLGAHGWARVALLAVALWLLVVPSASAALIVDELAYSHTVDASVEGYDSDSASDSGTGAGSLASGIEAKALHGNYLLPTIFSSLTSDIQLDASATAISITDGILASWYMLEFHGSAGGYFASQVDFTLTEPTPFMLDGLISLALIDGIPPAGLSTSFHLTLPGAGLDVALYPGVAFSAQGILPAGAHQLGFSGALSLVPSQYGTGTMQSAIHLTVPEPSSGLLLAFGLLAGLAGSRRWRRSCARTRPGAA